jgi:hypothetical protein
MSSDQLQLIDDRTPPAKLAWRPQLFLIASIGLSGVSIGATAYCEHAWFINLYPTSDYWIAGVQLNDRQFVWAPPLIATLLVFAQLIKNTISPYVLRSKRMLLAAIVLVMLAWITIPLTTCVFALEAFPAQQ